MNRAEAAASREGQAQPRVLGGRYHLLARLGSGGMASVYVARDAAAADALVAVKLLHEHLDGDLALQRDFVREAAIARRIVHPNVVTVGEGGTDSGAAYLLMEYVAGDTLHALQAQALEAEPLPVGVALRIVVDLLRGLHAAHELRGPDGAPSALVHRDVSPHNVLIGIDGVAKLTDFGVARIAERTALTAAGLVKGKLRYMAPEQVTNQPLDRRADIWAAAVILWELLANRRLYDGDDGAVIFQLVAGRVPSLAEARPQLPAALTMLFDRALAREPGARVATAAELADELEALGLVGTRDEVGTQLRARLASSLQERETSILHALRGIEAPVPAATAGSTHTGTRVILAPRSAPKRRAWWPVAALVVAAIGVSFGLLRRATTPALLVVPSAPIAPAASNASSALARPAPTPVTSPAERVVTATSSAPLASLERVHSGLGAALAIPRGSLRVDVPGVLAGDVLRAIAVDGRRVEVPVGEGDELVLSFAGPVPTARPSPQRPKGAKDGLQRHFP